MAEVMTNRSDLNRDFRNRVRENMVRHLWIRDVDRRYVIPTLLQEGRYVRYLEMGNEFPNPQVERAVEARELYEDIYESNAQRAGLYVSVRHRR